MSNFQSPQLLADLYRDLRDRRLLPLLLVLVVAIAVVPIALSSAPKSPKSAAPSAPSSPVAEKSGTPATQVVTADPGVRDYQLRLGGRTSKDPFEQLFEVPSGGGGQDQGSGLPSTETGGSADAGTPTSSGTAPSGSAGTAPTGGTTSQPTPTTQTKFYFYRVKVRSGQVGGEMTTRENVKAVTPLPSEAVPALAFLGVETNSKLQPKTAVFLVSSSVSLITGDGKCSFAGAQCQLLALEPGEHADLTWTDGLTYRVTLVKFNLIARNELPSEEGKGDSAGRRTESAWKSPTGKYFTF